MNIYLYVYFGLVVLVLLSSFLPLFGLFESRDKGKYCFRRRRFLITTLCLFMMNLAAVFLGLYGIKTLVTRAAENAEIAVLRGRAVHEYTLNNLAVMFPKALNDEAKNCYRSAISNFVEDRWNKYFYEESCNTRFKICAHNEYELYENLRKAYLPKQNIQLDVSLHGEVLGAIWLPASDFYRDLRKMYREPEKDGKIAGPPDEKMLADYKKYFDNCASLNPLPWFTLGEEVLISRPHLCLGRCP